MDSLSGMKEELASAAAPPKQKEEEAAPFPAIEKDPTFSDMEEDELAPTAAIVIDASNVCWGAAFSSQSSSPINRARPPLLGLSLCINFFERHRLDSSFGGELEVLAVAPDWWQRETHMDTEDQQLFDELVQFGRLVFAPPGQHDDLIILEEASFNPQHSLVVTNDRFRDHTEAFGLSQDWLAKHRVGFGFKLGSDGRLEFCPELANLAAVGEKAGDRMEVDICRFFEPAMWELASEGGAGLLPNAPEMFQHIEDLSYDESNNLGVFIGAGGSRIKKIQQRFGCEIHVLNATDQVLFRALSNDSVLSAKLAFFALEEFRPDPVPVKSFIAPLDSIKVPTMTTTTTKTLSVKAASWTPTVAPIDPIPYQPLNVAQQPRTSYVQPPPAQPPQPAPIPLQKVDVPPPAKKKSTIAPIDKLGKKL